MSVGSVGSSSSKPSTPSSPSKTESSGGAAAKVGGGASASGSAAVKSPEVKADAGTGVGASAVADKVSIDKKAAADTGAVSADLMSGLHEAYGAEDAKKAEDAGEVDGAEAAKPENPYSDIAEYSVSMKPEAWTKDRTPAEGQVAKNDHLEGMLRNQGYDLKDIYAKGEDGKTMIDRVAEANGLSNPDLITPDKELVLPSRHEPPMTDKDIKTDELDGKTVEQTDYAEGDGAVAETKVEADKIKDSKISQQPEAKGDGAQAKAEVKADEIVGSVIDQMPKVEGEDAKADAGVKAGTIDDSVVRQSPVALGDGAQAAAEVKADVIDNSVIKQDAKAEGEDAKAKAEVKAGEISGSDVDSKAAAKGDGAEADAAIVAGQVKDSTLDAEAIASGDDAKAKAEVVAGTADEDTKAVVKALADGDGSQADALANLGAGRLPGDQAGSADVLAAADGDSHAASFGAEDAKVVAASDNGKAAVEVDAGNADVLATGKDVSVAFEGIHNQTKFDVASDGLVDLHDKGLTDQLGPFAPMYSGNAIKGNAEGRDLSLKSMASDSVDVAFTGLEGDNKVEASLPGNGAAKLDAALGDGNDFASALRRDDNQNVFLSKTEGNLVVDTHAVEGTYQDSTGTFIDAGNATVSGTLRGGTYGSDDLTMLKGGNYNGLRVEGGQGDNDTLVLDVAKGDVVPAIVTREAWGGVFGLGAHGTEGVVPEGWKEGDAAIYADGVENILVRQDGKIIGSYGNVDGIASFEDAVAAAKGQ